MNDLKKKCNILIVDSDFESNSLLISSLETRHRVKKVKSAKDCLAILDKALNNQTTQPALLITEVKLPDMTGMDLVETIRSFPELEDLPILFISSEDSVDFHMAAYAAGGNDYFVKPYNADEIVTKVQLFLEKQKAKAEIKKVTKTNLDIMMTTLTSLGELGIIIHFVRESYQCKTVQELMDLTFSTVRNFSLEGSMLVYFFDEPMVFFSDGQIREKEQQTLLKLKSNQRIIHLDQKYAFNSSKALFFVRNMPDDKERTGRYKDHILMILDAIDARLEGLMYKHSALTHKEALEKVIVETKEQLQGIDDERNQQKEAFENNFTNMGNEIRESLFSFNLEEGQEENIKELINKTESEVKELYQEWTSTEVEFNKILMKLYLVAFE